MKTDAGAKTSNWLTINSALGKSKGMLFCLPCAGSGSAFYHSWKDPISADMDLVRLNLPGREVRLRETPATRIAPLIAELAELLEGFLDRPFAIFGHSMGALLSFELARAIRSRYGILPRHLFVSGFRAPQLPPRYRISELSDAPFIERLREYGGIPEMVTKNPELMDIFLPIFRADFELLDSYMYQDAKPLECPITAFGGDCDPKVSQREISTWRLQTSIKFNYYMLPGGHFFINESKYQLMNYLCHNLKISFNGHQHAMQSQPYE